MAKIAYSNTFIKELSELDEKVADEVWRKLELVEAVPGVGSALLDSYLSRMFGPGCLKIAACQYDVIYERGDAEDGEDEKVLVHGIIHQRRIR